jgi:hypothetical protein
MSEPKTYNLEEFLNSKQDKLAVIDDHRLRITDHVLAIIRKATDRDQMLTDVEAYLEIEKTKSVLFWHSVDYDEVCFEGENVVFTRLGLSMPVEETSEENN